MSTRTILNDNKHNEINKIDSKDFKKDNKIKENKTLNLTLTWF